MLSFPAAIRVYLCTRPCDMRRSFDGLSMMDEHVVRCDPFSGHLLVFCNRRSDRVKILYWDRDGWAIWYKQLEEGTYQFPFNGTGRKEITAWELGVWSSPRANSGRGTWRSDPTRSEPASPGTWSSTASARLPLRPPGFCCLNPSAHLLYSPSGGRAWRLLLTSH